MLPIVFPSNKANDLRDTIYLNNHNQISLMADLALVPGGFGHHALRHEDRGGRCCPWTGIGEGERPPQPASQEAWPGAELGGQSPGESRSRAPEGERAPEADELRRLRTLVCGARRARSAGSWRHELALRGIGWMRLSALRSLFDCRGRVYFCAWSWVELGHDMSRERCRASAPAKRGRGTTRRVVEGAAEQTIVRAFRKDDLPQLNLRERSGWRVEERRPSPRNFAGG